MIRIFDIAVFLIYLMGIVLFGVSDYIKTRSFFVYILGDNKIPTR